MLDTGGPRGRRTGMPDHHRRHAEKPAYFLDGKLPRLQHLRVFGGNRQMLILHPALGDERAARIDRPHQPLGQPRLRQIALFGRQPLLELHHARRAQPIAKHRRRRRIRRLRRRKTVAGKGQRRHAPQRVTARPANVEHLILVGHERSVVFGPAIFQRPVQQPAHRHQIGPDRAQRDDPPIRPAQLARHPIAAQLDGQVDVIPEIQRRLVEIRAVMQHRIERMGPVHLPRAIGPRAIDLQGQARNRAADQIGTGPDRRQTHGAFGRDKLTRDTRRPVVATIGPGDPGRLALQPDSRQRLLDQAHRSGPQSGEKAVQIAA